MVITSSGKSAQFLAKYRPICPVLALTHNSPVGRKMQLLRGVHVVRCDTHKSLDEVIAFGIETGRDMGLIKDGSRVVVMAGIGGVSDSNTQLRILTI